MIFFFLGRYSHTDKPEEIIKRIKKKLKDKVPLGAVKAPTRGEIEYRESGREAEDKIMEKHLE